MNKLLRLAMLTGIVSLASLLSPGAVTSAQAACTGYGDCPVLAGKGCMHGTPCCWQGDQGYCNCANGRYSCAF